VRGSLDARRYVLPLSRQAVGQPEVEVIQVRLAVAALEPSKDVEENPTERARISRPRSVFAGKVEHLDHRAGAA